MNEPKSISLTVMMDITAGADAGDPGAPGLPRFSMVAYTGGPMRIAGWRYPVVVDLAGPAILRRGSGRIGSPPRDGSLPIHRDRAGRRSPPEPRSTSAARSGPRGQCTRWGNECS